MNLDILKFDISKVDTSKVDISSTKIIQIAAGAFLLVISIINLFLFLPLLNNINQAKVKQKIDAQEVVFANSILTKHGKLGNSKLISQEKTDELMDAIYDVALKNNVKLNMKNDLSIEKEEESYSKLNFNLDAEASLKNLGNFIAALKEMPDVILDVAAIGILSNKQDLSSVKAQISFALYAIKK